LTVEVKDGVARLADGDSLAGSTLTQDRALSVAVEHAKVSPVAAVEALTLTPARVLGLEKRHGLLAPGFVADAVQLDAQWHAERVWANGIPLH
jgi:N-acetylglucosamine-6-phosphate deacetylase